MSKQPQLVTGGCLCEALRYEITFSPNHDFSKSCATCQCWQCRKQTGALIFRVQAVENSSFRYTTDTGSLQLYHASPAASRGFCAKCGSVLFWRDDASTRTSFLVGCFDKDILRDYGTVLTASRNHEYCNDEIAGVTDHLEGLKWRYDEADRVKMPDSA